MKAKALSVMAVCLLLACGMVMAVSDGSNAGSTTNLTVGTSASVNVFYQSSSMDGYQTVSSTSGSVPGMTLIAPSNEYAGWWVLSGTPTAAGTYTITLSGDVGSPWSTPGTWSDTYTFVVTATTATVTFNGNGGTAAKTNQTTDIGSQITLPSASKQYYSFSGWYTAQSGGTRVGGAGDSYTVSGDVILYAQYNVIPVSFTTIQDTEYIVQGSSFSYTAGTSPADASLSVSGASWLSVSGKNVAGTASPSVNPGTYHVTLTASYGTQSAVQSFDIVVVEKLIFESVPTGGIIALPA